MSERGFRIVFILLLLASVCRGEERTKAAQSPRQAVIEMFSGGEAQFRKHLTVEMQAKLQEMMKDPSSAVPLQAFTNSQAADPDHFQAFDLGPILFSFNNPEQHERYEVQLDTDEPRGDDEIMGLSLHLVRNGIEQEIPVAMHFVLNLKRQEGTWRLNAITLSATLPLGDPRILNKSLWNTFLAANGSKVDSRSAPGDERSKMSALRSVRMIGMAEDIYAQNHPGIGYTCRMSDLVNVGKGLDEDGVYRFMDSEFAGGVYNGYRFTLTGCDRKPARSFRIVAEPVAGKGHAYCSDNTKNLRVSDDGRGITCLISGKIARR